MADPHIKSPMDFLDYMTVIVYRLGFVVATLALASYPFHPNEAHFALLVAGAMLASSVHLYLKSFRFIIQYSMWIGLLCQAFGFNELALGAAFLVIGALCFKEYFCFRIVGLNLQPILFALLWFCLQLHFTLISNILIVVCSVLLLILTIQKWRMPLHFDIGDKTK